MTQEIIKALEATLAQKQIDKITKLLYSYTNSRIWLAGNGGSAYNCSHFASDLMNLGFDVTCMDENIARVTAITNDYGWSKVYEHQLWHFKANDVLVVLSVHGGTKRKGEVWSNNLVKACETAKAKQGIVVALLGGDGGAIKGIADYSVIVPHKLAYVVEGIHSVLSHLICHNLSEIRGDSLEV